MATPAPPADKAALRRLFLSLRDSLTADTRLAASRAIAARLAERLPVADSGACLVYLPMRGEVDLRDWVSSALAAAWNLALPRADWRTRELVPARLRALDEVIAGRHGVPDVLDDRFEPVSLDQVSVVLVPGVAFDRRGYRLGYGGGFYDRLLPRLRPDCLTVGIAFDQQVVDALPAEPHDQRVGALLTERGWQEM